jgi:hypothetical protein
MEVGADAAADLDLDDFMVFGNDADKAKEFFRELLFRHGWPKRGRTMAFRPPRMS